MVRRYCQAPIFVVSRFWCVAKKAHNQTITVPNCWTTNTVDRFLGEPLTDVILPGFYPDLLGFIFFITWHANLCECPELPIAMANKRAVEGKCPCLESHPPHYQSPLEESVWLRGRCCRSSHSQTGLRREFHKGDIRVGQLHNDFANRATAGNRMKHFRSVRESMQRHCHVSVAPCIFD